MSKRTAPTGRRKKVQDEKEERHRWSWSCFTVTWHRDKVIMKLFSMTRWSRSFSLWQGDHGASPWLSTLLQRHDHQHFSSKLGKIFMDLEEMCVCVCVFVCRSFTDLLFFLCAIGSTQVEHLQGCWCWWLISWWWWWWWWWYTKDQIQKIEGFEIAITIPHQHS